MNTISSVSIYRWLMLFLSLAVVLSVEYVHADLGNVLWTNSVGGSLLDFSRKVDTDAAGNVFAVGSFKGTADFDPSMDTFNLTSVGELIDIFITKEDSEGNFLWAKSFGGINDDYVRGHVVDSSGNVYLTGGFVGAVDFDPGPDTYTLTSYPGGEWGSDIFISKLDGSGNFLWAKAMVGDDDELVLEMAMDKDDNVYISGYFRGTVDFDPSSDTYNLSSAGNEDIFVCKLDSDGNFLWAKAFGGPGWDSAGLTVDSAGNIYFLGAYSDTVDFDPGPDTYELTSNGDWDFFISSLDSNGNLVWAESFDGEQSSMVMSINTDNYDNILIVGYFVGTFDADPGPDVYNLTSLGYEDVFVMKLNSSGNLLWAKSLGGSSSDYGYDIASDSIGNIYMTGVFNDTVDFDPGPQVFNLTSLDANNIFITQLDENGNFLQAKGIETNMGWEYGSSIAFDKDDNFFIAGTFQGTVDFNPEAEGYTVTSAGHEDVFITKFNNPIIYPLNLEIIGTGKGTVTSDIEGIDCPGDCNEAYIIDQEVILTATADGHSSFKGWSGDCIGIEPTCIVTMDQARNAQAHFHYFPWHIFLPNIKKNIQP